MVSRNVPSPTGVAFGFVFSAGAGAAGEAAAVCANTPAELTAEPIPTSAPAISHFLHSRIDVLPDGGAFRAHVQCPAAFHAQGIELGVAGGGVVEDAPYFVRFFRPVMQRERE